MGHRLGLGRLRRFFSPQLAEAILSGGEDLLKPHRREIGVAVDRLFAKMFAAVDHKYGEGDGEQRAEKGAKISVRFPVVRHGNLR